EAGAPRGDVAFVALDDEHSKRYVPRLLELGYRVIDKSNTYRADPNVPLVAAGVNHDLVTDVVRLVSNPNCTTIPLTLALGPLQNHFGVESVTAATYQAISGAGVAVLDQFLADSRRAYSEPDRLGVALRCEGLRGQHVPAQRGHRRIGLLVGRAQAHVREQEDPPPPGPRDLRAVQPRAGRGRPLRAPLADARKEGVARRDLRRSRRRESGTLRSLVRGQHGRRPDRPLVRARPRPRPRRPPACRRPRPQRPHRVPHRHWRQPAARRGHERGARREPVVPLGRSRSERVGRGNARARSATPGFAG